MPRPRPYNKVILGDSDQHAPSSCPPSAHPEATRSIGSGMWGWPVLFGAIAGGLAFVVKNPGWGTLPFPFVIPLPIIAGCITGFITSRTLTGTLTGAVWGITFSTLPATTYASEPVMGLVGFAFIGMIAGSIGGVLGTLVGST